MSAFSKYLFTLVFTLSAFCGFAQTEAVLYGQLKDRSGNPIEGVTIGVPGEIYATTTDKNGNYELTIPASRDVTVIFSFLGYEKVQQTVNLAPGERRDLKVRLKQGITDLNTAVIEDTKELRTGTLTPIDPKTVSVIANPNGSLEAILKTLPGVVSNNELSSQYSVRGGNFDENLVYVNDIEVYRPFLARSGQQEGLSFANSDMVSSIKFSAGGFDAKYGDKMSSVLDIQYRKPRKTAGNVSGGLLGGSAHVEGTTKGYRFTYQIGVRQRSNQYLLKSLDTKGNYKPSFADFQTFLTYDVTEKFELNFLGSYARNKYLFIPETRQTEFGTFNQAMRLTVYFDGKEQYTYETGMGAIAGVYKPNNNVILKFISSAYSAIEAQYFDVQGQYYLDEIESNFGSPDYGNIKFNLGVGTFLNHARNVLQTRVISNEHKGYYTKGSNYMQWGIRAQNEFIQDKISEWNLNDSSGYSLPYAPTDVVNLAYVLKSKISLTSTRISGYFQNRFAFSDTSIFSLTAGGRFNYWDINKQLLLSPRATFSVKPKWDRDFLFRFSSGFYYQPPFYREMRDFNGKLNTTLKAQQSIHFVAASDYNFKAWNRPFKFISEVYYKQLNNLVPYEVDNVRLQYFANNDARGYATGVDFKVNGEFVKDVESWLSLSVMKTAENLKNDYYYDYYNKAGEKIYAGYNLDQVRSDSVKFEPGYIPRPSDQRVTFSMFFQDYVPKIPSLKMSLNLVFGSGLPFGPPDHARYKDVLRMTEYRRVDIGFSYMLKKEGQEVRPKNPLRFCKSAWIGLDVFNLLGINNTVSYLWIKDITNRQYGIPNYLSARLLNLRLNISF